MLPLLSKTTKPFIIYVLVVLVVSIPVYYLVVDAVWTHELDEHNKIVAEKTSNQINRLKLPEDELKKTIELWNAVQPTTNIQIPKKNDALTDSLFTVEKPHGFLQFEEIDRFRCLSKIIHLNGKPYRFRVETNIEESQETLFFISATTLLLFLIMVGGLLILNRRLSGSVWKPFRNTLDQLKDFSLNRQTEIAFERTQILEFEELHDRLRKMIRDSIRIYGVQKEFTENASHEMQTPLAIIKNKVDLLLQSENLTEAQYLIAEDINLALSRSARINKNLLLLAKIENRQFELSDIQFDKLLRENLDLLEEHFSQKDLVPELNISENICRKGNAGLTEVLISNLLLNAIRHTANGGTVAVSLTETAFSVANSGSAELPGDMLFRRFYRMSQNNSGSGLGLAIVQEICRSQHWTVGYDFKDQQHIFSVHF
ncbi:histidine kinase [Chryseobacterium sp. Leaf180]|uniref:sensor histidine kinase n=1 Tax=Chryseobacterium sp. Leaf180 TaxID=1736289 RepID=UPI0007010639|nr:HAMP domain-containing sensor histidine kinase [Chryseobacterium sp. Leaf180]KQR94419.1 histidine kinase [Chryseobacterium sp. Leaf180]